MYWTTLKNVVKCKKIRSRDGVWPPGSGSRGLHFAETNPILTAIAVGLGRNGYSRAANQSRKQPGLYLFSSPICHFERSEKSVPICVDNTDFSAMNRLEMTGY